MKVFTGGAWRNVTSRRAYVGGAWRRVTRRLAYIGGSWRTVATFYSPLTVTVSPDSAAAFSFSAAPTVLTTNTVTAVPSGGLGPYTYAWTVTTFAGDLITATSPSIASTAFSQFQGTGNTFGSGQASVLVTDSLGNTATATAEITFEKTAF